MNKLIAITIGDIKGIGIEILIKSWENNQIKNFVLVTNIVMLKNYLNRKKKM